jgi:UDP-N-acetylglucosamine--N-acetylmuramyl-(pentapeptide) pyrophosphoryl-undecaprenol N-acetylglucosamine transferase
MKVLIAGGGTGGHIYPALSIARKFKEKGKNVIMVGRKGSMEERIYSENGFPVCIIHSALLDLSPLKLASFLINLTRGIIDAMKLVAKESPDIIIGAGGYVSAPILLAAFIMRKKYFIYEQNIVPGRTNRLFGKGAELIFLGFPDIYHFFGKEKAIFAGNPVRDEIFLVNKEQAIKFFNFTDDKNVLLIFGGSGGARKLNLIFAEVIGELLEKLDLQVIFITGKRDFKEINAFIGNKSNKLVILPYLNEMAYALKAADFAVTRGGAMTLTELIHSKLPALIVPFPYARDNHQLKNALFLKDKGCVDLIEEKNLSANELIERIFYYFKDIDIIRKKMESCADFFPANSAEQIYKRVMEKING